MKHRFNMNMIKAIIFSIFVWPGAIYLSLLTHIIPGFTVELKYKDKIFNI